MMSTATDVEWGLYAARLADELAAVGKLIDPPPGRRHPSCSATHIRTHLLPARPRTVTGPSTPVSTISARSMPTPR